MTNVIYYDGDRVTISKQSKRNLPHIVTVRDINGKHKKQFSFKTASEARKKYLDIENAKNFELIHFWKQKNPFLKRGKK